MDKHLAEQLMKKLHSLDEPINDACELVEQIADEHEMRRFRKGLGELMGHIYTDLMIPILRQYPDLDPDKDVVFEEDDPLRWNPELLRKLKENEL